MSKRANHHSKALNSRDSTVSSIATIPGWKRKRKSDWKLRCIESRLRQLMTILQKGADARAVVMTTSLCRMAQIPILTKGSEKSYRILQSISIQSHLDHQLTCEVSTPPISTNSSQLATTQTPVSSAANNQSNNIAIKPQTAVFSICKTLMDLLSRHSGVEI